MRQDGLMISIDLSATQYKDAFDKTSKLLFFYILLIMFVNFER